MCRCKYACAELGEYCLREKFEADCSGPVPTQATLRAASGTIVDGRIVMRSAQYGRPHLGRCVQRHFHGFQGCVLDVLPTMDRLCSGRRTCSVDVFETFGSLRPCSEIESFLEADFVCVPGMPACIPAPSPHEVDTRSTQPCIPPGSLNRVPASAGVRAGTSPLPGGR